MNKIQLVVIDTETGGLDTSKHCVIEIAARIIEIIPTGSGYTIERGAEFHERIKPYRPVSPQAAKVNGYNPETWGGVSAHTALGAFCGWCHNNCTVQMMWAGCNPGFDRKFIESECRMHGVELPSIHYRTVDVESLALPLYLRGKIHGIGLRHLRQWALIEGEQSHSAPQDVDDTITVLWELLNA